jgi:chloride channel 3/4/5
MHFADIEQHNRQSEVGRMITLLLFATVLRTVGTVFSYGCKVPCGIFVPSMAIGATFGRMLGLIAKSWQSAYPDFFLFSSCQPDVPVSIQLLAIGVILTF